MNRLSSRQRKFLYMAGILALMVPIIMLGMPTSEQSGSGGRIARLRTHYELGEANLGQVDPASATMNLVLLGMRGIAANLLWMEADELKETKNWSQLDATVESIILLQPHFQSVWKYQAWNLGYNVSAECDAVEDRYFWVKKGMKFLMRGIARNTKVPELYHDTGDYFGKKLGRSDEKVQFRKYFLRDPDEVYGGLPDPEINPDGLDNYLVAKKKYQEANDVLERPGVEQHKMALPLFWSYPYRSQMDYASALQDEGNFGEVTREGWATAYREWTGEYGREPFETNMPGGKVIFEATDDELRAMCAEDGTPFEQKKHWQQRYQDMVNYRYWRMRCDAERRPEMAEARRLLVEGRRLFREVQDIKGARDALYAGLEKLQSVASDPRFQTQDQLLLDETELVEETIKAILIWQHALRILNEPVPSSFPMDRVWTDPTFEGTRADLHQRFLQWVGGAVE